jgi:hypothetical protein
MITLTKETLWVAGCNVAKQSSENGSNKLNDDIISDHIKQHLLDKIMDCYKMYVFTKKRKCCSRRRWNWSTRSPVRRSFWLPAWTWSDVRSTESEEGDRCEELCNSHHWQFWGEKNSFRYKFWELNFGRRAAKVL